MSGPWWVWLRVVVGHRSGVGWAWFGCGFGVGVVEGKEEERVWSRCRISKTDPGCLRYLFQQLIRAATRAGRALEGGWRLLKVAGTKDCCFYFGNQQSPPPGCITSLPYHRRIGTAVRPIRAGSRLNTTALFKYRAEPAVEVPGQQIQLPTNWTVRGY